MAFRFFLFILIPCYALAIPGYHEPWGKNSDLAIKSSPAHYPVLSPLGHLMQQIIYFHQNFISQIDGPRSHFKPSSSNYMLFAIRKHGFFKGYLMGCDRLLRENEDPWVYRTALMEGKIWKVNPPP